jgi:hypothetical protein
MAIAYCQMSYVYCELALIERIINIDQRSEQAPSSYGGVISDFQLSVLWITLKLALIASGWLPN